MMIKAYTGWSALFNNGTIKGECIVTLPDGRSLIKWTSLGRSVSYWTSNFKITRHRPQDE